MTPSGVLHGETVPASSGESTSVLADHDLERCLSHGAFGEVWKARDRAGRVRAVHFLAVRPNKLAFVAKLAAVQHENVLPVDTIQQVADQTVMVTEFAEQTLWDRFNECRKNGEPGIPRRELLAYLRDTAAALDYLAAHHSIQHLALNPANLWLRDGKIVVANHGLAQFIWIMAGLPLTDLNPLYAPPELFKNRPSSTTDQYGLALIFLEMLGGRQPFPGRTTYEMTHARLDGRVDLAGLSAGDRAAMERALDLVPAKRFPSCLELIETLQASAPEDSNAGNALPPFDDRCAIEIAHAAPPTPHELISDFVRKSMGDFVHPFEHGRFRCRFSPEGSLLHKFAAWLPASMKFEKFAGFLEHWRPQVVQALDDRLVFRIALERSFLQMLRFQFPAIEVEVGLKPPKDASTKLTEIAMQMRYVGARHANCRQVLEDMGPVLVESIHRYLLGTGEQRARDRFPFQHPFDIALMPSSDRCGPIAACEGRDISSSGIGFYMPYKPAQGDVMIFFRLKLAGQRPITVEVPASVQRIQPIDTSRYLVGARFLLERSAQRDTILLVEDNDARAQHWERALGDSAVFALTRVHQVEQALHALKLERLDLLVLGGNREEFVLPALKRFRDASPVPIVVAVGDDQRKLGLASLQHGAQDFLCESMDGLVLARTVQAALARQRSSRYGAMKREREQALSRLDSDQAAECLVYHDEVTGLPNRQLFYDRLHQVIEQARRHEYPSALLALDIDDFKRINDTLGPRRTDLLLKAVARRLQQRLRAVDTVARIGVNQFGLILDQIARPEDADYVAQSVMQEMSKSFDLDNQPFDIRCRIGSSIFPTDGNHVEALIRGADLSRRRGHAAGR